MRSLIAAVLCASVAALVAVSEPNFGTAQDKKDDKKAKQKVDPKTFIPDDATKKQIAAKTEELRKAVAELKAKKTADDVLIEVEIYLKAAENIVRFEEWLHKDSVKWAQTTLDKGLERAKQADGGRAVWRDAPGKWVVRAYRSKVDGSIQPYAVLLPHDFNERREDWRLDVVLHGRDGALTEAKFISTHQGAAPKDLGYVQMEVYGRGNNAYRWAGETDVWEAIEAVGKVQRPTAKFQGSMFDPKLSVLRGFSMGGAGTWHIGLHHPDRFCVIGPGAGFTTTHGYIANLPKELPDYQEKCLRIYDALGYAENAFNVPVVAYSGEKDAQKKAADNIESVLKDFKEPLKFTHLVAPGLEHQMPKEWQEKAEAEYRKYVEKGREPERVRFVTYTPKYGECDWVQVMALDNMYEKAVIDAVRREATFTVTTSNVREVYIRMSGEADNTVIIDGQQISVPKSKDGRWNAPYINKRDGKWALMGVFGAADQSLVKRSKFVTSLTGPIDDAFTSYFWVVNASKPGWHTTNDKHNAASLAEFARVWDRYFRGELPVGADVPERKQAFGTAARPNLVLFGDPESSPLIAKVLPKLPITWTKDKLVMNGVEYDSKTHVPMLIYPNPLNKNQSYVVINSGHTFGEADLKGTNALLYPRLGDWAVIKPTPTDKDPAAYEVVAAGLFDENWQFPKKK